MLWLDRINGLVNRGLAWAAGLTLVGTMLFTVLDMVLRALGRPVAGSFEVIGWLSAAAMALALGYTQLHRGHVAIDLVVARLEGRARHGVETLTHFASLLLFCAVAAYVAQYGNTLRESGSLSETLKAIVYPWVYVVALGAAGLALALLVDFLRALRGLLRRSRKAG
ncbi:MAG: TRAP transporter small permease subunit [Burkholderiales bacterium]|nr:TRAP transporter small permease subunit [Burkholderiales bacterium]